MQMMLTHFLEQSMSTLTSQQGKFREQMEKAFGGVSGFGSMEDQVRRNMEMFEKTFAMFSPFTRTPGSKPAEPADTPASAGGGEMDALKRQLDDLQKRLDKMGGKD